MPTFAVDARNEVAQRLAPDAKLDCPNMSENGRFQYVIADSLDDAINIAIKKYNKGRGAQ